MRSTPATGTPRFFKWRTSFADERPAAAHQHHHIAGPDRPIMRLEPFAAIEPIPDARSDCLRQPRARLARAALFQRWLPGRGDLRLFGLDRRPELDEAGIALPLGDVADDLLVEHDAVSRWITREYGIDRREHRRDRAERDVQRHAPPPLARRALEMVAHRL